MGKCFFAWRAKSLLIPPVSVFAETFALASGGRAMVTLPLTDLSETDFFSSAKFALTEPLTVDSSTWPASPAAVTLPFTELASTSPFTFSISIPPFTVLMRSRRLCCGTVNV